MAGLCLSVLARETGVMIMAPKSRDCCEIKGTCTGLRPCLAHGKRVIIMNVNKTTGPGVRQVLALNSYVNLEMSKRVYAFGFLICRIRIKIALNLQRLHEV